MYVVCVVFVFVVVAVVNNRDEPPYVVCRCLVVDLLGDDRHNLGTSHVDLKSLTANLLTPQEPSKEYIAQVITSC